MKKFIVMALMLLGLVSNASAGSAIPAYSWNIIAVASDQYPYWDDVYNKTSTTQDHGGTVIVAVYVKGYSNPVVTFNNSGMQLDGVDPYDSNGDGTIDAWMYYYIGSGPSGNIEVKDYYNGNFATRDTVYVR